MVKGLFGHSEAMLRTGVFGSSPRPDMVKGPLGSSEATLMQIRQ